MKAFDYFMVIFSGVAIVAGAIAILFLLTDWQRVSEEFSSVMLLGAAVYFGAFGWGIFLGLRNLKAGSSGATGNEKEHQAKDS